MIREPIPLVVNHPTEYHLIFDLLPQVSHMLVGQSLEIDLEYEPFLDIDTEPLSLAGHVGQTLTITASQRGRFPLDAELRDANRQLVTTKHMIVIVE